MLTKQPLPFSTLLRAISSCMHPSPRTATAAGKCTSTALPKVHAHQSTPHLSSTRLPEASAWFSIASRMCSGEMYDTAERLHSYTPATAHCQLLQLRANLVDAAAMLLQSRRTLTLVAASNVFRTSLLKGMLSWVLMGFFLPDSDSTAARAFSTVNPLFMKPCLLMVSSAISPSNTCSVVTCSKAEQPDQPVYSRFRHPKGRPVLLQHLRCLPPELPSSLPLAVQS